MCLEMTCWEVKGNFAKRLFSHSHKRRDDALLKQIVEIYKIGNIMKIDLNDF